jgi:hypothetical protein
MKHAMTSLTWLALLIVGFAGDATAAIWRWGCVGPIGNEQIIFGRNDLIVVPAKPSRGTLRHLIFLDDLATGSDDFEHYNADDGNSGLESKLEFTRDDDPKRKLTLTEKSSKRVSHRSKLVACRDETIDTFRKVYRYERDDMPARNVTMECMEYQLSTKGGRICD